MHISPHIIISPHRDDACFSLAATINLLGGGHLINIFTQSQYTAQPSLGDQTQPLKSKIVSAIRNKEDAEFSEAMNLQRHELGFDDADLRGLSWSINIDQEPIDPVLEQATLIAAKLVPLLQEISAPNEEEGATIYCPMAIGGHRDHLATLIATQRLQSSPWGRSQTWIFYEDLPYASWPHEREKSIDRFQAIMKGQPLTKHCLKLSPESIAFKMKLVNIYASQHPSPPVIQDFICNDSWLLGPHEGLWKYNNAPIVSLASNEEP